MGHYKYPPIEFTEKEQEQIKAVQKAAKEFAKVLHKNKCHLAMVSPGWPEYYLHVYPDRFECRCRESADDAYGPYSTDKHPRHDPKELPFLGLKDIIEQDTNEYCVVVEKYLPRKARKAKK